MPTEKEILLIQKAAMYDLQRFFKQRQAKTYTFEEIQEIIDAYITGAESLNTDNK